MTGYEQKVGLLGQAAGKRGGTARWRVVIAAVVLAIVAVALIVGVFEYRHKEPAVPVPSPTCCAMPIEPPVPPVPPGK
jgi:hypothetical protein